MLSILLSATTITMNRGEQETLFRQSRNLRLQHEETKAQQVNLLPITNNNTKSRHYSYGNIHQVSNLHMQSLNSRSFGEDRPFGTAACDDLVLSVLKSPLRDTSSLGGYGNGNSGNNNGINGADDVISLTTRTRPPPPSVSSPQAVGTSCGYTALRGSEDELLDDVESAIEPTIIDAEETSTRGLKFLRRFRPSRPTRFEHTTPHLKRVPTPMKRKRGRSRSRADILDSTANTPADDDDTPGDDEDPDAVAETALVPKKAVGVPDPYYPIALPIDQAFKAKYVFHHRRGKTFQERLYVFLEHPGGWLCFIYHFTV